MTEFSILAADYLARQAERFAELDNEVAAMKAAMLPVFSAHGIAKVEVRFDGCGDSGIIEEYSCFALDGAKVDCPDVVVAREGKDDVKLASLLEEFAYEALERHHGG